MPELRRGVALSKYKEYESRKERHDKAQNLVDEGKLFEAVKIFRENLDWSLKNFGQDHETTVYDQETLAYTLNELGHSNTTKNRGKNDEGAKEKIRALFKEARDLDALALETRTRAQGTPHPSKDLLETQRNLANDYVSLEDYSKAAELFKENYDARRTHPDLGEDDESTLRAGHDLAGCWHKQNRFRMAKALNEKILEARIRLKKPEADIGRSRNALYWNNHKIQERTKVPRRKGETEQKVTAKGNSDNVDNGKGVGKDNSKGRKVRGGNGLDDGKVTENQPKANERKGNGNEKAKEIGVKQPEQPGSPQPLPVPNITFKYVDPRASGINRTDSDASSIKSGSNGSNNPNLPFRRGSGQGNRPSTPHIINADPGQRRSKPIPRSPELNQASPSASSENLKPTGNNSGKNSGPSRARSLSNNKDKDRTKPPTRARSTSPPSADRKHYRQLSDAGLGKDDENSAREVGKWFYSLETETQALLVPLRRSRGKRVKIAILDTGIDIGHPYFAADQAQESSRRRIKACEDFLDEGGSAQDICGHGTHSVGILRKVAPEADIYVARVAKDFDHDLNPEVVAKAIYRACRDKKDEKGTRNWNVDIITMSFGFYGRSKVVQKAIQEALAKPVLVFAAASNNGTMKEVTFPAWLGGVMCINSATASGTPSLFNPVSKAPSNFSILGEDIKSAWIRSPGNLNAEKVMSGTSVATPIAAAVAALVLEFVLQNDPESVLIEQLEDLKHQDGMPEVFATMVRSDGMYRNIVPWALLSATDGRRTVTSFIEKALRNFRGV